MAESTILVTGVTGRLGKVVIDDLLGRMPPERLAALARDPGKAAWLAEQGVDVRRGDYEDPGSLEAAFAGIDVLLLVSSPDLTPGARPRQHGNVIEAARRAGVRRIVYTSAIGAGDGPEFLGDHRVTEQLLRDSGVACTVLRNTFYVSGVINSGLKDVVAAGELRGADGGVPAALASIEDLGLAASAALTADGQDGVIHELRGVPFTLAELAGILTELCGTEVTYREVEADRLGSGAFFHALIASGLMAEPTDDLERLIGRPPTPVRDLVRAALAEGTRATAASRGGHVPTS